MLTNFSTLPFNKTMTVPGIFCTYDMSIWRYFSNFAYKKTLSQQAYSQTLSGAKRSRLGLLFQTTCNPPTSWSHIGCDSLWLNPKGNNTCVTFRAICWHLELLLVLTVKMVWFIKAQKPHTVTIVDNFSFVTTRGHCKQGLITGRLLDVSTLQQMTYLAFLFPGVAKTETGHSKKSCMWDAEMQLLADRDFWHLWRRLLYKIML